MVIMSSAKYEIAAGVNSNAIIEMGDKTYQPQEVASILLTEAIKETEKHIYEVTEAVIAVPYHYQDDQLNAIRESAKMVGINDVKIIFEQ